MQGLLLHAIVHSAGVQDRDGGIWLLATLFGQFPFLAKLFANSAYAGSIFHTALGKSYPTSKPKLPPTGQGWENLNRSALAFLKLASIRLMLRKLCNP
jgi:hypothetical protein